MSNVVQRFIGGFVASFVTTRRGLVNASALFSMGSVATGITAFAGGGQTGAILLTAQYNRIDTVVTAADSAKLPLPSYVGQVVIVMNNDSTDSLQMFGSGTDTINGVATATGVAQAAGKMAEYHAESIGTAASWRRMLSA